MSAGAAKADMTSKPCSIVIGDNHAISFGYQFIDDYYDQLYEMGFRQLILEADASTIPHAVAFFTEQVKLAEHLEFSFRSYGLGAALKKLDRTRPDSWPVTLAQPLKALQDVGAGLEKVADFLTVVVTKELLKQMLNLLKKINENPKFEVVFSNPLRVPLAAENYMPLVDKHCARKLSECPSIAVIGFAHIPGIKAELVTLGAPHVSFFGVKGSFTDALLSSWKLDPSKNADFIEVRNNAALLQFLENQFQQNFLDACALGDVVAVQSFIHSGGNVHCIDSNSRNASHYIAMRRGDPGRGLLVDIYRRHHENRFPEDSDIAGCLAGRLSVIDLLLSLGINFDRENSNKKTARLLIESQRTAGEEKDRQAFQLMAEKISPAASSEERPPSSVGVGTCAVRSAMAAARAAGAESDSAPDGTF